MNLNFRKTALLAGICSVFSLGYAPQLFAVTSVPLKWDELNN